MDLRAYYQKIKDHVAAIAEEYPIVVSLNTGDGGTAGQHTEVTKPVAARLLVQGLARLAEAAEAAVFRQLQAEAVRKAQELAAAAKVQISVVSTADLEKLKGTAQPKG